MDNFDLKKFLGEKSLLNESAPGYDTRKFGESLPTTKSVKGAYEAKKEKEEDSKEKPLPKPVAKDLKKMKTNFSDLKKRLKLEEGREYDIDAMADLGFDVYPGGRSEAFKYATEDLGISVDEILGKMDDDMVYNAIHHSLQTLGMYHIDEAKEEEDEM